MLAKQNDPISKEKKINTTPINYVELNQLSEDFGKRFVPQQELSAEQAFWLQTSNPNTEKSDISPVRIEAPSELLKVSSVNISLKKLKIYLSKFDIVVKKRITPDAITEGEWGFEHTKADILLTVIISTTVNGDYVNLECKIYKDQFDSVKRTRVRTKEHSDSLIAQMNSKSVENADLKAQFKTSATTIVPGMFKIDLDPLAPRFTSTKVVPPKENTSHSVETKKPELKIYSRRPKLVKSVGLSKISKIVESRIANNSKPNHYWRSTATDVPSSSSLVNNRWSRLFSGLLMLKTYGREPLLAHELHLEVAFQKNTCFIRNLDGVDLLSGSRDTNLYTISLDDMLKTSPICLLSKALKTKSWLWHRRLSNLNFEPKNFKEAMPRSSWIDAMQEEIHEFERLEMNFGGILKNKVDGCQGFRQDEGIRDLGIIYTLVARIMRLLYLCSKLPPNRWEVKNGYINGELKEEVTFLNPKDLLIVGYYPSTCVQAQKGPLRSQTSTTCMKYGMLTSDSVDTPMVEKNKLDVDLQGTPVDATHYRGIIGSLMYLATSRPDLIYAVCLRARYQAKPTEKHLNAVKRIFRYLNGTIHLGLWYSKATDFTIIFRRKSCGPRVKTTRRSTQEALQFFRLINMFSWSSKKQTRALADSSTEVNILPLSGLLVLMYDTPFIMDASGMENGVVELYFFRTEYQLADIFTKALSRERFNFLIEKLGMRSMSPATVKSLAEEEDE
ncbi:hypothetical protein Tco_1252235 [Tanacetum coccineum]